MEPRPPDAADQLDWYLDSLVHGAEDGSLAPDQTFVEMFHRLQALDDAFTWDRPTRARVGHAVTVTTSTNGARGWSPSAPSTQQAPVAILPAAMVPEQTAPRPTDWSASRLAATAGLIAAVLAIALLSWWGTRSIFDTESTATPASDSIAAPPLPATPADANEETASTLETGATQIALIPTPIRTPSASATVTSRSTATPTRVPTFTPTVAVAQDAEVTSGEQPIEEPGGEPQEEPDKEPTPTRTPTPTSTPTPTPEPTPTTAPIPTAPPTPSITEPQVIPYSCEIVAPGVAAACTSGYLPPNASFSVSQNAPDSACRHWLEVELDSGGGGYDLTFGPADGYVYLTSHHGSSIGNVDHAVQCGPDITGTVTGTYLIEPAGP